VEYNVNAALFKDWRQAALVSDIGLIKLGVRGDSVEVSSGEVIYDSYFVAAG
jgi:hypothetical protein